MSRLPYQQQGADPPGTEGGKGQHHSPPTTAGVPRLGLPHTSLCQDPLQLLPSCRLPLPQGGQSGESATHWSERPSLALSSDLNFLNHTIRGSLPSYPFPLGLSRLGAGLVLTKVCMTDPGHGRAMWPRHSSCTQWPVHPCWGLYGCSTTGCAQAGTCWVTAPQLLESAWAPAERSSECCRRAMPAPV